MPCRINIRFCIFILTSCLIVGGLKTNTDCFCKLKEVVDDCTCGVDLVHRFNNVKILPLLELLVQKEYFRFFPVNLKRPCRFWADDGRCSLRDCHVKGCSIDEMPIGLRPVSNNQRDYVSVSTQTSDKDKSCPMDENAGGLGNLDRSLSKDTVEAIKNWTLHDDKQDNFCEMDDELPGNVEYVDLLKNRERYTGYKGASANRIWNVIYKENCFPNDFGPFSGQFNRESSAMCLEKRVFHRLISGLHTSITVHLCHEYLLQDLGGFATSWGPNKDEFVRRFDPRIEPEGPQRLKNLYFIFLVELRALVKAAPYLSKETYFTGNAQDDENTQIMINDLLHIAGNFSHHFDESRLFRDGHPEEIARLKASFRHRFRNITHIMDCVGCDKCKLWGKLQIQGLGTALKILFSSDDVRPNSTVPHIEPESGRKFQLRRLEIMALINALSKLSKSIFAVGTFQDLLSRPLA